MARGEAGSGGAGSRRVMSWLGVALWSSALLTLYDLAAIRTGELPWAGAWTHILEQLFIGLLFYLAPLAVILPVGGLLAGFAAGGRSHRFPSLPVAAGQAVALLLACIALGTFPLRTEGTNWLTAPWVLEMLIVLPGCCLAGWAAARIVGWACRRPAPGPVVTTLALLPAIPALLALPGVLLAAGSPWPDRPEPRAPDLPDILVIVADTLRADRVNGPEGERIMPVIRRLADRGVRFDKATAPSSWTIPSTASIMTGVLPVEHGMRGYTGRIDADHPTLAEMLEGFGYETAGITANPLVSTNLGFDRGFHHWDEEPDSALLTRHGYTFASRLWRAMGQKPPAAGSMKADLLTEKALRILREPRERPLFLYLHYFDPHDPYGPPAELAAKVDPGYEGSLDFQGDSLYEILRGEIDVDDRDIQHARALYDAEISWMDGEIDHLMREISGSFEEGRTVVAFTSDHGEEFMEHGALGHEHTLYEELIHVPLIVARPGHLDEGLVVSAPVSLLDLVPTLMEAAGLPPRGNLPGRGLASLAPGAALPGHSILSEVDYKGYRAATHGMRSIREGDLKAILYEPNVFGIGDWRREIFDLGSDPSESSPLSSFPGEPEGLEERLADWHRRSTVTGRPEGVLDPATEERLKALGYIE